MACSRVGVLKKFFFFLKKIHLNWSQWWVGLGQAFGASPPEFSPGPGSRCRRWRSTPGGRASAPSAPGWRSWTAVGNPGKISERQKLWAVSGEVTCAWKKLRNPIYKWTHLLKQIFISRCTESFRGKLPLTSPVQAEDFEADGEAFCTLVQYGHWQSVL